MNQRRVEVAVRVRPDGEPRHVSCVSLNHATHRVNVQDDSGANAHAGQRSYREDLVFDAGVSNRDVFEALVLPKMRGATPAHPDTLCFLAYGHTSSGKTYSIAGSEAERGILAMCVEELLRREGVVEVAMLEVYLDAVHDLLAQGAPREIRRRQGPQGPVIVVESLTTCALASLTQWDAVAAYGMASRRTAPTERNARSSRSHAIFTIKSGGVRLCLVDLAGSERQTVFSPQLNKESISINKSLSRLSTVLEALSNQRVAEDGSRSYVNFRDTTLTVLLQRYLTGASMTTFLACVHPNVAYYQETLSTLRYTQRLKRIRTRVTRPEEAEWSGVQRSEHQVLLDELTRLRQQMQVTENTTKLVEAAHQRRIAELEQILALQSGGLRHALPAANAAAGSSAHGGRARDTRRVAGWLLSRVLGDLPELNVGYDAYFDGYFPSSVQVIGYVSTMACLVPRDPDDDSLAFLDVGDLAMGLSMLDAGVPPLVRLHRAGCADPSGWEACDWGTSATDAVHVLAFFELNATAMTHAAGDDALPCCGGFVTSAPLLPIASVLCVAASAARSVKEDALQRLIDLQCEQHEAVVEQGKTSAAHTPSLASSTPPSQNGAVPAGAALLDASLVRDVASTEREEGGGGGGQLAREVRRQAADTLHLVTPFKEDTDDSGSGCDGDGDGDEGEASCDGGKEGRVEEEAAAAATRSADVRRDLSREFASRDDSSSPTLASPPPPVQEEPTAPRSVPEAAVPPPRPCVSPPSTPAPPLPPPPPPPAPERSVRPRRKGTGEGKTVKMQSCQGCVSM